MFNVCFQCGLYRNDKIIDPAGPYAICPECGFKHRFLQLPLMIVSGASCAGKSTVCRNLISKENRVVLLDSDIIWRPEFNSPETKYRDFFETWLRLGKNISQSGRPVVLFGAGAGVPENLENCIERRYFSKINYLSLVCSDEKLEERLKQRPEWRGTHNVDFIQDQVRFNNWFKENKGEPKIELIDTTLSTPEETTREVLDWLSRLI
jgi:hypothetical protein